MILGTKLEDYNDFEKEIISIVGDISRKLGLKFYFEHIYQTFLIAEKAILNNAKEHKDWFDKEDFETQRSLLFYDANFNLNANPLTHTLHDSHFITIHSKFESIWKDIVRIHNQHYPPRAYFSLSNNSFISSTSVPTCLLDRVVVKNKVLISYNYLRNKLTHQNASTTSSEFVELKRCVDSGEIYFLKISIDGTEALFTIEDIKFVQEYCIKILSFLSDIANTSYLDRRSSG